MIFLMVLLNLFNDILKLQKNFKMKSKKKINCKDFIVVLIISHISFINSEKFANHYFKGLRKILVHRLHSQEHTQIVKDIKS